MGNQLEHLRFVMSFITFYSCINLYKLCIKTFTTMFSPECSLRVSVYVWCECVFFSSSFKCIEWKGLRILKLFLSSCSQSFFMPLSFAFSLHTLLISTFPSSLSLLIQPSYTFMFIFASHKSFYSLQNINVLQIFFFSYVYIINLKF